LKKSSPRPGWLRGTDTAVGYVPIRFDLNDSSLRSADDDPISIFGSPRAVLGHGVTLSATSLWCDESMKSRLGDQSAMYAVTTNWGRFDSGFARSGWLFHHWFPNDMPIHTFSPHWVFDKNMRHAAVFFKVHVMPDNSGYIHLCAMSSYHYLIRLHTTAGTERSGELSWSPSHAAETAHDTWPFSCHFESTKETVS